jgi:hypothetical protein
MNGETSAVVKMEIAEIVRLSVKDGDILFVDAEAVDAEAIQKFPWFKDDNRHFIIIPVMVPKDKTVADCLAVAGKEAQQQDIHHDFVF